MALPWEAKLPIDAQRLWKCVSCVNPFFEEKLTSWKRAYSINYLKDWRKAVWQLLNHRKSGQLRRLPRLVLHRAHRRQQNRLQDPPQKLEGFQGRQLFQFLRLSRQQICRDLQWTEIVFRQIRCRIRTSGTAFMTWCRLHCPRRALPSQALLPIACSSHRSYYSNPSI